MYQKQYKSNKHSSSRGQKKEYTPLTSEQKFNKLLERFLKDSKYIQSESRSREFHGKKKSVKAQKSLARQKNKTV